MDSVRITLSTALARLFSHHSHRRWKGLQVESLRRPLQSHNNFSISQLSSWHSSKRVLSTLQCTSVPACRDNSKCHNFTSQVSNSLLEEIFNRSLSTTQCLSVGHHSKCLTHLTLLNTLPRSITMVTNLQQQHLEMIFPNLDYKRPCSTLHREWSQASVKEMFRRVQCSAKLTVDLWRLLMYLERIPSELCIFYSLLCLFIPYSASSFKHLMHFLKF